MTIPIGMWRSIDFFRTEVVHVIPQVHPEFLLRFQVLNERFTPILQLRTASNLRNLSLKIYV